MKALNDAQKYFEKYTDACTKIEDSLRVYLQNSCESFQVGIFEDECSALMIVVDDGNLPLRYALTEELVKDIKKFNGFPFSKYKDSGV